MSSTTRKRCRSGESCHPVNLKEALDCLGHHSDRSLREIAELVGRTESTLGKECSRYDEEHYPPLRLVVPLTVASGNDALISYLARACHGVFVHLPGVPAALTAKALALTIREFGELLEAVARSMADGRVTAEEFAHIEQEWQDVVTAGAAYLEHLRVQCSHVSRSPAAVRRSA